MEIQDFAEEYAQKSDEELLRLALDREDLTPEANLALESELNRRNIHHNLQSFKIQEEHRKEEQDKNPGALFTVNGIGRKCFGRAEYIYDPKDRIERFKTTVFVVLFWFPLIPTGTFLVERKRAFLAGNIRILQRLPLSWEQVMKVRIAAAIFVLALIWALKFLPRILLGR